MFTGRHIQFHRVGALGIICVILLVLCPGCSRTEYPQLKMSLVWETTVSGDYVLLYCMDTGAVDLVLKPQNGFDKHRHEIRIDSTGRKSPSIDWSTLTNDAWDGTGFLPLTDRSGWIAIDSNRVWYSYVRQTETGGTISGSDEVRLNSNLRKINREGRVEWERPGLADIGVLYADSSIVCIYGKDPAVLRDIDRSGMFSDEYAKKVLERYAGTPTVVQILHGATGSLLSSFQISPELTPVTFLRESLFCEGPAVVAEQWADGIRRFAIFSVADGEAALAANWRDLMPEINVEQALVLPDRIVVAGSNGSVSLLDRELKVLWTRFPKGAKDNVDATVRLLGTPAGNMVAVSTRFAPYLPRSPVWAATMQLTVFDANGNTVLNHGNLEQVTYTGSGKIFATAKTNWETKDHLYLFDLTESQVKIWRTEIPGGDQYRRHLSPSGEYMALTCKLPDIDATKIELYRLEGAE